MARTLTGTVVSDKADKTIVINVTTRHTHPLYKKQYTLNTRYMAHDEKNEAKAGDVVSIAEVAPLSRRKRFSLSRILERGGVKFEEADATADLPQEPAEVESPASKIPAKTTAGSDKHKAAGKRPTRQKPEEKVGE